MNTATMHLDWAAMYLICFGVGLGLSLFAFAGNFLHLHLGSFHLGGHMAGKTGAHAQSGALAPVNGFTLVAFLCWFGGTGYLLSHGHVFTWTLVMGFAMLSGLAGAVLVFWFLVKVLLPREH